MQRGTCYIMILFIHISSLDPCVHPLRNANKDYTNDHIIIIIIIMYYYLNIYIYIYIIIPFNCYLYLINTDKNIYISLNDAVACICCILLLFFGVDSLRLFSDYNNILLYVLLYILY